MVTKKAFSYTASQMASMVKLTPGLRVKVKCGATYFLVSRQSVLTKCTYNSNLVFTGAIEEGIAFVETTVYES